MWNFFYRFILHAKKTGFIVEHDFIMATYLADRVIVFEGQPSVDTIANSPQSLLTGMNKFLESLEITFRRDPANFRPRINKLNSVKVHMICYICYIYILNYDYFKRNNTSVVPYRQPAANCSTTVKERYGQKRLSFYFYWNRMRFF